MRKEIFKLIVAEFEKLGINPTKWFGTRTNVKRLSKNTLSKSSINEYAIKKVFEDEGPERLIKIFNEEAKYLAQLNDVEANQLLSNLKTVNKVVNPPAKPEAGIYQFSKLPGKKLTPDEYIGKQAADEGKIMSAQLNAAMETSKVDQDLAKRLNLDMSKISDFNKLQAWKKEHNVPDFHSPEGIASLFKTVSDNPLADLGTQLDAIEAEGKSLVGEAQKLVDLAWKMSPEGQAAEEAIRKDILRRGSEGKGFAGGVFGDRNEGFFRALVRPFLLAQHDKGRITLAENTYNSLKNMDDLKGGGDFISADPVRVFRQHYGNDAFDLIPNEEAFSMGPSGYGPTTNERVSVLEKVIGKPIMTKGPDKPGGYLTKGEYQAKIDHQDEILGYMNRDEGRFGDMKADELAEEMIATENTKKNLIKQMNELYPPSDKGKSYKVISEGDEGFDEISKKLGITAKPGFPVTEAGKADLKVVKTPKQKDPFGIRLMKNFDQDLTDEGLAQEGYNLQEIDILKRARNVMKDPEKDVRHPTEALRWVRGDMADEAGVDIDEFMTTFNWDDKYAQGGGVGSMFRRV